MSEFTVDGILYQILDNNIKNLRVGTGDKNKDGNAVTGSINKMLRLIETYEVQGKVYFVEQISTYSFRNCALLDTVYVPDSVKTIAFRAFDCSSFKNLVFTENSRLTSIGYGAICGTKVKSLSLPKSLSSCDGYCLSSYYNLRDVHYSFDGITRDIRIHLSSDNELTALGNHEIIKNDNCALPIPTIRKCSLMKRNTVIPFNIILANMVIKS